MSKGLYLGVTHIPGALQLICDWSEGLLMMEMLGHSQSIVSGPLNPAQKPLDSQYCFLAVKLKCASVFMLSLKDFFHSTQIIS